MRRIDGPRNTPESGVTLVEILIVILTSLTMLASAFGLYGYAVENTKRQKTLRLLNVVREESLVYAAVHHGYDGLKFQTDRPPEEAPGFFEKTGLLEPGQKNGFGGTVTIWADSTSGVTYDLLHVRLDGIPLPSCVKMAIAYDAGAGYIKQLHVNDRRHYFSFPIGLTELNAACLDNTLIADKNKRITQPAIIEWVFGLPSNAGL